MPELMPKATKKKSSSRLDSFSELSLLAANTFCVRTPGKVEHYKYIKQVFTFQSMRGDAMTNEDLVLRIQSEGNNSELIGQLYKQNTGLIWKAALALAAYEDPEDLRQEGYFGLMTAVELWRPDGGANFATYAAYWIRQAMTRYIENSGSVIRIPSHQRERIKQYKKILERFRTAIGRDPSSQELTALLGVNADQLEQIRKDALALSPRSMSEAIAFADELVLEDTIPDPRDDIEDLLDEIQKEELSTLLWKLVDDLGGKQAEIIRKRYKEGLTLKSCGDALGVSIEGARQIEVNALRKMKRPSIKKKLLPYIDEQTAAAAYQATGLGAFRRSWASAPERAVIRLEKLQEKREEI